MSFYSDTFTEFSTSEQLSGIYGTVASIFLFMGSYSVGITPVTQLYPPEVLSYPMRGNGMAMWAGTIAVFALVNSARFRRNLLTIPLCSIGTTLVFPIALQAISWRLYFIIGAWDLLETVFVAVFWVETKGKTLEEIDQLFEGVNYTDGVSATGEHEVVIHGKDDKLDTSSIARSVKE
jgi:hypothetical protein